MGIFRRKREEKKVFYKFVIPDKSIGEFCKSADLLWKYNAMGRRLKKAPAHRIFVLLSGGVIL